MKRPAAAGSQTQDTSDLSCQCSATELRQPDNHQPSQSSICTAQVVLNASVAHPAATQWLSGCRSSVAEHCMAAQARGVLGSTLYFRLITSKFFYFPREARCSEQMHDVICFLCMYVCVCSEAEWWSDSDRRPERV